MRPLGGVQWEEQRFLEGGRQISFNLVLLSHGIGGIWYNISLKLGGLRGSGQMNQLIYSHWSKPRIHLRNKGFEWGSGLFFGLPLLSLFLGFALSYSCCFLIQMRVYFFLITCFINFYVSTCFYLHERYWCFFLYFAIINKEVDRYTAWDETPMRRKKNVRPYAHLIG